MVKVLENRIVDLDIMPGTKEHQEATRLAQEGFSDEQIKSAIQDFTSKSQQSDPEGFSGNLTEAGKALGETGGGAVKGVLDTTGNTVGALGEGLGGVGKGVGEGLYSTGKFGAGAVGTGVKGAGSAVGIGGRGGDNEEKGEAQVEKRSENTTGSEQ